MSGVPREALAQRLVLADGLWTCAWCAAYLNESTITHREDCHLIATIAAAEREHIRERIEDEYGPSEARKMRRVLLGDTP